MPTRRAFSYNFNTGAGTQTINQLLDPVDLSWADQIRFELFVTKADTDAADTLDVYLQSRGASGKWDDRIRATRVTGDMSPTVTDPKEYRATLQKFDSLSDTEEEDETSSSSGTRLAAGTVLNGPFPGLYFGNVTGAANLWTGSNMPEAGFRLQFDVTDADNDADFEGTVVISADSAAGV